MHVCFHQQQAMEWCLNSYVMNNSSRLNPLASQNHCRERKHKYKHRANDSSGWNLHRNTVSQTHTISNVLNFKVWWWSKSHQHECSAHTCSVDIRKSPAHAYLTAATLTENTMNAEMLSIIKFQWFCSFWFHWFFQIFRRWI